jgi:uncharacterized membrane protein YfcA
LLSIETLIVVSLTFLVAGAVKGVIGLGLPTVSLGLLTATYGLTPAMALLIVPSFVTNLWQGVSGGALVALLGRLWMLLIAVCIGTWLGGAVLANADTALLTALLGVLLCVYAGSSLIRPRVRHPGKAEPWLSPLIGAVNGVLTGMTGSFVVPGVLYLQALAMPRDVLIQAMGILFTVSTVALAVSLGNLQLFTMELASLSLIGVAPALLGMVLGRRVRQRLSEKVFTKVFFVSLLILGLYIAIRSLSGI